MYQFKEMPKDIIFIDDDNMDDSIDEGKRESPAASNRSNSKGKGTPVSCSSALPKIFNLTSGQDAFMTLQQSPDNITTAPGYVFYDVENEKKKNSSLQKCHGIQKKSLNT